MIVKNGIKGFSVTFPNKAAIDITNPLADGKTYGSTGGDGNWLAILESAAGKYLLDNKAKYPMDLGGHENLPNATPYDMVNNDVRGDIGVQLLTGNKTSNVLATQGINAAARSLNNAFQGGKKVVIAVSGARAKDGIEPGHAYAVIGYGQSATSIGASPIELYNPRGTNPFYMENGVRTSRNATGPVFQMSLKDFIASFGGGNSGLVFED